MSKLIRDAATCRRAIDSRSIEMPIINNLVLRNGGEQVSNFADGVSPHDGDRMFTEGNTTEDYDAK